MGVVLADLELVARNLPPLLQGLQVTVILAVVVIAFGTMVGLVLGLGLTYGPKPLRLGVRGYVELLRGLPLLVTIFIIFYGLPIALGISIDRFVSVAVALSLFAGAHVAEVLRGAINAIPNSLLDAAKSIGLTSWPRIRYIVAPLAFRTAVPPWVNLGVEMIKGTSLVSLVSISDLTLRTNKIIERTREPILFYVVAALIYFSLCFFLSRLGRTMERRLEFPT